MYYNMYICTARCVIVFIWQCDARMCGWRSNTRAQHQPQRTNTVEKKSALPTKKNKQKPVPMQRVKERSGREKVWTVFAVFANLCADINAMRLGGSIPNGRRMDEWMASRLVVALSVADCFSAYPTGAHHLRPCLGHAVEEKTRINKIVWCGRSPWSRLTKKDEEIKKICLPKIYRYSSASLFASCFASFFYSTFQNLDGYIPFRLKK